MKSKEILPESERLTTDHLKFFKKDVKVAKYHEALLAAEKELEELHALYKLLTNMHPFICPHSWSLFNRNETGHFWAVPILANGKDTHCTGFGWNKEQIGFAYFHSIEEAVEWNKKKFNW